MHRLLAIWLSLLPFCAMAQQQLPALEELLESVMTVEDSESEDWQETLLELEQQARQPFDLNTATREQLEGLTFLTPQQIEDLLAYLYQYGPMKSFSELRMLPSIDNTRLQLLPLFVYIGQPTEKPRPSPSQIARYGQHELMGYTRIPFQQRKGDSNGYLGYPYKHWLQYTFNYSDYVKAGLVGSQDAGEPFFAKGNGWGYDFYSFYLQLKRWRRIESAVVGRYKISTGMGLVVNNSFGLGKLATLQNLGRSYTTVRAHSSRSAANYFQGAAATLRLGRKFTATAFASYRPLDATLNNDGSARTIVSDGYHRTPTEMGKKSNTYSSDIGANLQFRYQRFHLGATVLYTHLDRRLEPQTSTRYRRFYAQGADFLNVSTDYGYASRRLSLNGETALNRDGAVATINVLSLQTDRRLSLMLLQRFYSYRYTARYARSFSEGSSVQNESGIYVGGTWQPSPNVHVQAYTDFAYFPWARYRVSLSSHASDNLVALRVSPGRFTLQARYRLHLRQRDDEQKTRLVDRSEHRARLSVAYAAPFGLTATTQADFSMNTQGSTNDCGYGIGGRLTYRNKHLLAAVNANYFRTDSYDSRIYLYEQGPLYTFSFPNLYGHGLRYAVMLKGSPLRQLTLTAKLGITNYFDRATIGTGLQQTNHSALTDLDVQVGWKF